MDDLEIVYTSPLGRQVERKYTTTDTKIELLMRVATSVDLKPLHSCTKLEILELSDNQLESIDLTPLRDCSTLKQLRIGRNRLKSIDLWPLWNSKELEEIDLVDNRLEEVNLTPVIQRSRVRLDEDVRTSVDNVLRYLLSGNDTARISLCINAREPIELSPRIEWNPYDKLIFINGWKPTYQRLIEVLKGLEKRCWFRAQKGLLEGFRIHELAGYDGDPMLLLKGSEEESEYHRVRNVVYDNAIELLEDQIKAEGSTLFLDVGRMVGTRAMKLVLKIVALREKEIQEVVVPIKDGKVNLMLLWYTHFGNEILRVLRFGATTNIYDLQLIENSLQQLGYNLRMESIDLDNLSDPSNFSDGLKEYVDSIAEINQ